MTFTARVHNGAIAVPPGVDLAEGAEVEVQTRAAHLPADAGPLAWMRRHVGAVKDLPEDFAAEHDHYIHGAKKRKA